MSGWVLTGQARSGSDDRVPGRSGSAWVRTCSRADQSSGPTRSRAISPLPSNVALSSPPRPRTCAGGAPRPLRTVGDLLEVWIGAGHDWKPATWVNYRGSVRRLLADPLAHRLLATLHPPVARAVMLAWTTAGMPVSTAALNVRILKAAAGWAYDERLLAAHPLGGMRGPGPGEPRRDVPLPVVRELLLRADQDVEVLRLTADADGSGRAGGSCGTPSWCGCCCGSRLTVGLAAVNSPRCNWTT